MFAGQSDPLPRVMECSPLAPGSNEVAVIFCSPPSDRGMITLRSFSTVTLPLPACAPLAQVRSCLFARACSEAGKAGRRDVVEVTLYYVDAVSGTAFLLSDDDVVIGPATLLLRGADSATAAMRAKASLPNDVFESICVLAGGGDDGAELANGVVRIRGLACVCVHEPLAPASDTASGGVPE